MDGVKIDVSIPKSIVLPTEYRGLKITQRTNYETKKLIEGRYVINGSLHKYFNAGKENSNRYTYNDFRNTLIDLYTNLGIDPRATRLYRFEFGFNIVMGQKEVIHLLKSLFLYKNHEPTEKKRSAKIFVFDRYILKFYQKKERKDVLRIEIKVIKKCFAGLNKWVQTLSDLLDARVYCLMRNIILDVVDKCIFVDVSPKQIKQLSRKEQTKIHQYSKPTFWKDLNKKDRYYHKKEFRKLLKKYNDNDIKKSLLERVENEAEKVLNFDVVLASENYNKMEFLGREKLEKINVKNLDLCTDFMDKKEGENEGKNSVFFETQNLDLCTTWITVCKGLNSDKDKNTEKRHETEMLKSASLEDKNEGKERDKNSTKNDSLISDENTLPNEVKKVVIFCAGCGAMIENPRKNQKYCSAKVVGYEKAHQCRNNNSNPRNNTKRGYQRLKQKYGNSFLFDSMDLIPERKRVYLRGA